MSTVGNIPKRSTNTIRSSRLVRVVAITIAVTIGLSVAGIEVAGLHGSRLTTNDFTLDYVSSRAWVNGANPYDPSRKLTDRYLGPGASLLSATPPEQVDSHPPAAVIVASSISWMPYKAARTLWLLLSMLLIAGSLALTARRLGFGWTTSIAIGSASLAVPVVLQDLSYGQWNSQLLALMVLTWLQLRKRPRAAGLALGVAAALKLFPILMILPLIRLRAWRAAGWALCTAIVISSIGVILVGPTSTHAFIKGLSTDTGYWRAMAFNHSPVGFIYRWFTPSVWHRVHMNAPQVALALSVLVIAACVIAILRTAASRSEDAFWAATPWMLLVLPLAWAHTYVLLMPLVLCIIARNYSKSRTDVGIILASAWALSGFPDIYAGNRVNPEWLWLIFFALPMFAVFLIGIIDYNSSSEFRRSFFRVDSVPGFGPLMSSLPRSSDSSRVPAITRRSDQTSISGTLQSQT